MGHFVVTSKTRQNVEIGLRQRQWGVDRKGTPIHLGDTIEVMTTKKADESGRHIATVLVVSEPVKTNRPEFEWPDKQYPTRFDIIEIGGRTPDAVQEPVGEALRQVLRDDPHFRRNNFARIGGEDIGLDNWVSFQSAKNRIING